MCGKSWLVDVTIFRDIYITDRSLLLHFVCRIMSWCGKSLITFTVVTELVYVDFCALVSCRTTGHFCFCEPLLELEKLATQPLLHPSLQTLFPKKWEPKHCQSFSLLFQLEGQLVDSSERELLTVTLCNVFVVCFHVRGVVLSASVWL